MGDIMDEKLLEQLLELNERFKSQNKYLYSSDKEEILNKYSEELKEKIHPELKKIVTAFQESHNDNHKIDTANFRNGIIENLNSMLDKAKSMNAEKNFDISSQKDKPLGQIAIPGERYNNYRGELLERINYAADLAKIAPESLKNTIFQELALNDISKLINLDNKDLSNADGSYTITKPEFERMELAASKLGLSLNAQNVKGEKGDKINILIDNKLVSSINVAFASDDIGVKTK
jgi:hypothetical protein